MNLSTTIEIYAGGPGSGCKGPNCGRPKEQSHGALTMPRGRQTMKRIDKELRQAAVDKKVVLMEYKSDNSEDSNEKAKTYMVEPYSYRNDGKLFFGYDQTQKSIKAFKTENIVRVTPLGKTFKPKWPIEISQQEVSNNQHGKTS